MELYNIFEQLKNINSIKEKETLLIANKENEILKTLIELNLNPYKLFQFNKMPEKEVCAEKLEKDIVYKLFIHLTNRLQERKVTGNAAKSEVLYLFNRLDEEEYNIYSSILLKKPIGVSAKTVNKVWPKLIPEFNIMLAPNKLPNIMDIDYPIYVQPKLDGYRCIYLEGKLWSRQGKPFGNKNLDEYFSSLGRLKNYVLDGELYVKGISFNKLQTILNTENDKLPKGLKYYVYDCIPEQDWKNKSTKLTYSKRITRVRQFLTEVIADFKKIIDIPNDLCDNGKEAVDLYKTYLKSGYEGIMLKRPDGLYKWKRTTIASGEMLKLKPFKSLDLEVTGIYEGEGKYKDMAGGLVVNYNNNSVSVGSGFNDSLRKDMSESPNNFIGKVAEIKYFEETKDGSLRFPVFQRFRTEKD